ncbi:MAG: calcium/sodium antiporter [Gammaproteobacteria bacterium]|nr:MAG: calcium/sodium antiporter [Gammaproteobacteria bacterium]
MNLLSLFLPYIAVITGLIFLAISSDKFIDGSSSMAEILGVSPLIIGITIIGFGTSAPEIIVAIFASMAGNSDLAIGNALGSNIANIALVLGVAALFFPLFFTSNLVKKELPILLFTQILVFVLLADLYFSTMDSLLMIITLIIILSWMIYAAKKLKNKQKLRQEFNQKIPHNISLIKTIYLTLGGFIFLLISAKVLVWGAVEIAISWGVSDLVIGLSIVAVGTSLPELAAAISAGRKKQYNLIIGNVIGSNIFNTLAVLTIPALFAPVALEPNTINRDLLLSTILSLFLLIIIFYNKNKLNKYVGLLLVIIFITYQIFIF